MPQLGKASAQVLAHPACDVVAESLVGVRIGFVGHDFGLCVARQQRRGDLFAQGFRGPEPVRRGLRALEMQLRVVFPGKAEARSEEHTSELQSLMRISYAVFCLKKKKQLDTKHY